MDEGAPVDGTIRIPGDLPKSVKFTDLPDVADADDDSDGIEDVPGERLPLVFTNAFPRAVGPPAPPTVWCAYCGEDVPRSPRGACQDCEAIGPDRLPGWRANGKHVPPPLPPASLKPVPEDQRTMFERIAFPDPITE